MSRQLEPTSLIDMLYMTNDSGFTSKYFYDQIKKGALPPPIKFGRSSRWLLSDYLNGRIRTCAYFEPGRDPATEIAPCVLKKR